MGGKKKAAKKAAGDDDGDDPKEMAKALEAAVEGLKMRLVLEQERKDKSLTIEKQIIDHEKELRDDLKTQEKETKDCVNEMTVMYKHMEKKLQSDIDALKGDVETQEAEVAGLN